MVKLYTLSIFLFFTVQSNKIYAQCSKCELLNPSGNKILSGIVCFNDGATHTLGDLVLNNNVTLCISNGTIVTIQNNIKSSSSNTLEININGNSTLNINQPLTLYANLNATIENGSIFKMGGDSYNSDLKLQGSYNTINNAGTVTIAVLEFNNDNSTNTFNNTSTLTINGSMNISHGIKNSFQNKGIFKVAQSFSSNAQTKFVNCGTMEIGHGFNLGGGLITNTGSFTNNTGSVDLSTGKVYNYGTFISKDQFGGQSSSIFYNQGVVYLKDYAISNTLQGPQNSEDKVGYFYVQNLMLTNPVYVGPNLDFTRINSDGSANFTQGAIAIFNETSSVTYKDDNNNTVSSATAAGVSYNSSTRAMPITSSSACPLPDNPIVTPVQLVQFSATNNHTSNNLYWSTASEINFKYFEVEKSINSTDWDSIGSVTPKGSSSRGANYTFVDYNLSAGTNWYKLKMVDMDGTKKYSNIIALNSSNLATTNTLKVFPNPVKRNQQIQIQYNSISSRKIVVKLIDLNGRIIYSKYYSILSGLNSLSINIDTNITGVYLINLIDERNVKLSSSKIIVQ